MRYGLEIVLGAIGKEYSANVFGNIDSLKHTVVGVAGNNITSTITGNEYRYLLLKRNR